MHISPYLSLKFVQLSESTIIEGLVSDSQIPFANAYTAARYLSWMEREINVVDRDDQPMWLTTLVVWRYSMALIQDICYGPQGKISLQGGSTF